MLVSDRGLERAGLVEQVGSQLKVEERLCLLDGEPTAADVDRVADHLRGREVTVVGMGGGSALDLAKLAAAVSQGDLLADAYSACENPLPRALPLVLIPTTAGTGSEMTRTAVFTDSQGNKTWAWGDELQAQTAVLDPELTLGLPSQATALTAVDALSHALEAATATNRTSLTRHLCQKAVATIPEALAQTLDEPQNLPAREKLLNASALAGIALNSCGTGLAHALAHGLGTLVKIPHGLAIAWSLRVTLDWNPKGCYAEFPWLADNPHQTLCHWLDSLSLPPLPDFSPEELGRALTRAENVPMLENNAKPVSPQQTGTLAKELHNYSTG